jgi:tetratricopeptide (TPR) repeat protein
MVRWRRKVHRPGWRLRVTVAGAACLLAAAALGLLLGSVTTTSAGRLAWLSSVAAILAVVLTAWGMSAGMFAWALRSREHGAAGSADRGHENERAGLPSAGARSAVGLPVEIPLGRLPAEIRGRDALLAELGAAPRRRSPAARRTLRRGRAWVLAGMGGLGKSTVALAAAQAARSRGWQVWWVTATDTISLTGGMLEVLYRLRAPETVTSAVGEGAPTAPDRVWEFLNDPGRTGQRWLLVFDNADDPAVLAAHGAASPADHAGWLRASPRGTVIVTTRHKDPRAWGRGVQLRVLAPLDAAAAARVLTDIAPAAGDQDGQQARELGRRLGGLPLALHLAGSYLASSFAGWHTFADYQRALESEQLPAALADLADAATGERSHLQRTWDLSLDALSSGGTPQARPLLLLLSCFAPATAIPVELLRPRLLSDLLPVADAAAGSAGDEDEDDTRERQVRSGLAGLASTGLIDAAPAGDDRGGSRAVTVHPVVADANRARLRTVAAAQLPLVSGTAMRLLRAACDELTQGNPADWPAWRRLVPHTIALLNWASDRMDEDALARLLEVAGIAAEALVLSGDPGTAERLGGIAVAAGTRLPADHPARLAARRAVAAGIAEQGRVKDAEQQYRDMIPDHERVLGRDHPATLTVRFGQARVLGFLRDPKAEQLHRDVLADQQRVLGCDHPDTLLTRHWLGRLLVRLGRHPEAETIYRQALDGRSRVLGGSDPDTLVTRHTLAWAIAQQGRYAEAEQAFWQVLADQRAAVGDEHPHPLGTGRAIGWCIEMQGRHAEAEHQLRPVLAVQRRVRGHDHPATLQTLHILAGAIAAQGRRGEAEDIYRQVLNERLKVHGEDHPHTQATRQALQQLTGCT